MNPPLTARREVVDHVHGVEIHDPYRWLEDEHSPDTRAWVAAQNAYTRSVLDDLPGRETLRAELAELLGAGYVNRPVERGGRLFYTRHVAGQNQPALCLRREPHGPEEVLVDPNTLDTTGLIALDWWYPSLDGRRLAYGLSHGGDEKSTLHVLDVDRGEQGPERIDRTRYSSVAWTADGCAFYYTRYPHPDDVPPGEENYHKRVFFHRLGDDPARDPEVFGRGRDRQDIPVAQTSLDGRWLLVTVFQGWSRCDVYARDLTQPDAPVAPIAEGLPAQFYGEILDDTLYLRTNLDAPNYRLLAVDLRRPEQATWRELIPEQTALLEQFKLAGGKIIAGYLEQASSRLRVFSREGVFEREVPLPGLGSVTGLGGAADGADVYFGYTSFSAPACVYHLDPATGQSRLFMQADLPAGLNPDEVHVEQVWYTSRDGTPVSMFVIHRPGLPRTGDHPTVLYGYGGFNVSLTPGFRASLPVWLRRGGVYAIANLRGGAEYGEAWHDAGKLDRKQNVFDDFIAAAEWLVDQGYTRPERLAIWGGSNGGLLVGTALTQRPELFRAVVCAVPLLDMLRYHLFRIARLWIPEYGSAEDPEQFRWLHAYSPYHHVQPGVAYPAALLTTGASDSRVDPMHALKMAALLQSSTGSGRPVLLRVEFEAGHGQGKPLARLVDEATDMWSFVLWQLQG